MAAKSSLRPWFKTLVASATYTSDQTGTTIGFELPNDIQDIKFIMNITAASGTSPTLDVMLQTSYDGGTTYVNHSKFAQVTAADIRVLDISKRMAIAGQEIDANITTGSADANHGPLARHCRFNIDVGGTSPSFTAVFAAIGNREH
jgi:hypothetical protein